MAYGLAPDSGFRFWFDLYIFRGLPAKSLSVERHGAAARNDFDVFKPQRLAARRQQRRIFDWPTADAILEDHLRPLGLGQPVIAPFLQRQVGRKKIAPLLGQYIFVTTAVLRQRHACHHAEIGELLQTRAENIGRDTKIILKLVESPRAVTGFPEHQDRPAVT